MSDIAALTARIEKLEHELALQQDIHQIRRLQYTYGYFIDKSQYNEVVDLFAEDGDVWFLGGIYRGKAGVRRLYIERFQTQFTQGHNGPRYGWLLDHPQLQMVIDVAPDRRTARARGRSMMQAGLHQSAQGQQRAWWEGGIYENEYVRETDVWKIKALRYFPFWHGSFAEGWAEDADRFHPDGEDLLPAGPAGTGCAHRSGAAAVAGDRYRAVPLPAPGDRPADRARQQPCARGIQGWMRPAPGWRRLRSRNWSRATRP